MVRFFAYLNIWTTFCYVCGTVLISAFVLSPTTQELRDFGGYGLVLIFSSIIFERCRPVITVLRRFVEEPLDILLADRFLPHMPKYGRMVWLDDNGAKEIPLKLKRVTPMATGFQVIFCITLFVHFIPIAGTVKSLFLSVVIFAGSTWLLDASVGNTYSKALAYVSANLFFPLPIIGKNSAINFQFIALFVLFFFLVYKISRLIEKKLRNSCLPFGSTIKSRLDLLLLKAELWFPIWLFPRFIHNGPAVIRHISVVDSKWKALVVALLKRSKVVIMEVTHLVHGSSLEWEIKACEARKRRVLFLCKRDNSGQVIQHLRKILPEALILPLDFTPQGLEKLKKNGFFHQLAIYDSDEYRLGMETPGSKAFFGLISLQEWFDIIRMKKKTSG